MLHNATGLKHLGGQTGLGMARGRVRARGGSSHNSCPATLEHHLLRTEDCQHCSHVSMHVGICDVASVCLCMQLESRNCLGATQGVAKLLGQSAEIPMPKLYACDSCT